MALTPQEVALRLTGLPSPMQRELCALFEQLIDDVGDATGASEATTTEAGVVKQAANQADSTATDAAGLVTDFNGLLAKLKTAGLMAPDA